MWHHRNRWEPYRTNTHLPYLRDPCSTLCIPPLRQPDPRVQPFLCHPTHLHPHPNPPTHPSHHLLHQVHNCTMHTSHLSQNAASKKEEPFTHGFASHYHSKNNSVDIFLETAQYMLIRTNRIALEPSKTLPHSYKDCPNPGTRGRHDQFLLPGCRDRYVGTEDCQQWDRMEPKKLLKMWWRECADMMEYNQSWV